LSVVTPAQDLTLPPGDAVALTVPAGRRLRLFQVKGRQVADLVSFDAEEPTNRLSMFTSRVLARSWRLTAGDVLASTEADDLWLIEEDSADGEHYTGGGYCNPGLNRRRFGDPSGPTCRANFARVLGPLGLDTGSFDGDTCFNAFMRVEYAADGGFVFREPTSRAGDELVLRALRTQIVAVSNCPQARGPANAGSIKPLGVQLR
jgi:uncharacterized protein